MPDYTCPHCQAVLQKVAPTAEGLIFCTNCARRFSIEVPSNSIPKASDIRVLPRASYALFEVCSYLLPIVALILVYFWNVITSPYFIPKDPTSADLGVYLVVLIIGIFAVTALRRYRQIEMGLMSIGAVHGAMPERLDPPPKSSLPYIGAPMATGALTVIGAIYYFTERAMVPGAFVYVLAGCCLLLGGLAAGDVRRLLWRWWVIGQALSSKLKDWKPLPPDKDANAPNFVMVAGAISGLLFLRLGPFVKDWWLAFTILPSLAVIGNCYTLYRCQRDAYGVHRLWHANLECLRLPQDSVFCEDGAEGWLKGLGWFLIGVGWWGVYVVIVDRYGGDVPNKVAMAWGSLMGLMWMARTLHFLKHAALNCEGLVKATTPLASKGRIGFCGFMPASRNKWLGYLAILLVVVLLAASWQKDPPSSRYSYSHEWTSWTYIRLFHSGIAVWCVACIGFLHQICDSFERMNAALSVTSPLGNQPSRSS
ncbi:MAG: hypothetical protein KIS92_25750 [Planctomycetota bacterium]|nr:hypothetical protein [Planctomycetota bacterium]